MSLRRQHELNLHHVRQWESIPDERVWVRVRILSKSQYQRLFIAKWQYHQSVDICNCSTIININQFTLSLELSVELHYFIFHSIYMTSIRSLHDLDIESLHSSYELKRAITSHSFILRNQESLHISLIRSTKSRKHNMRKFSVEMLLIIFLLEGFFFVYHDKLDISLIISMTL